MIEVKIIIDQFLLKYTYNTSIPRMFFFLFVKYNYICPVWILNWFFDIQTSIRTLNSVYLSINTDKNTLV